MQIGGRGETKNKMISELDNATYASQAVLLNCFRQGNKKKKKLFLF